jgi:hypothetical protein
VNIYVIGDFDAPSGVNVLRCPQVQRALSSEALKILSYLRIFPIANLLFGVFELWKR